MSSDMSNDDFNQWWENSEDASKWHKAVQDAYEHGTNGDVANASYNLAKAAWAHGKAPHDPAPAGGEWRELLPDEVPNIGDEWTCPCCKDGAWMVIDERDKFIGAVKDYARHFKFRRRVGVRGVGGGDTTLHADLSAQNATGLNAQAIAATCVWRDPTQADLDSPLFEAIWQAIRTWDVNVPGVYHGYCGANGNHAAMILDSIRALQADRQSSTTAKEEGR